MLEGLEVTTNCIARFVIFEDIYLREPSPVAKRLREPLVALYSALLLFLGKAIYYFRRNTLSRVVKSIVKFSETTVQAILGDVERLKEDVILAAGLVDADRLRIIEERVNVIGDQMPGSERPLHSMLSDLEIGTLQMQSIISKYKSQLRHFFHDIEMPICRLSEELQSLSDNLREDRRREVYRWLSTVPYIQHHQTAQKGRLSGSGSWILEHQDFRTWVSASYSTILWIHGIPGSGKTKLM